MAHLFQHLIRKANRQPQKWQGIMVEQGQLVTSLSHLKAQTGISVRSLRTCINKLKSTSEITSITTSHYTIITICNYSNYQNKADEADTPNDTLIDKQPTSNRQATDKQPTTNKNEENEENEENKKKSKSKNSIFRPPTFEEVKKYITENPELSNVNAETFFKGFNDSGWIDTRGNPVKNWKLKLRTWSSYGQRAGISQNVRDGQAPTARQASPSNYRRPVSQPPESNYGTTV